MKYSQLKIFKTQNTYIKHFTSMFKFMKVKSNNLSFKLLKENNYKFHVNNLLLETPYIFNLKY
mgnify:CR=1 FL=1